MALRMSDHGPQSKRCIAALLTMAVAALLGGEVRAAVPPPTGEFFMAVSSSARLLDSLWEPDYYDVKYEEQCDNPHLRVRARNTPAIRIDNFSATLAPVTSVTLTINQSEYIFGDGDGGSMLFDDYTMDSPYTDAGVTILGSLLSADKKSLTINFDGLEKDMKAIFLVDLDIDPNDPNAEDLFPYPDYRNVLFGAPLDQGEPPTNPASITINYGDSRVIGPATLQQITEAPVYQNDAIRPYGLADSVDVDIFEIPEPSSVVLALAACVAAVGYGRRRSRR
jgi:hypothetical protein